MYRNTNSGDGDSDDDSKLPLFRENEEPAKKKANTIWSTTVIEQTLSEEGAAMRVKEKNKLVNRGVETFEKPLNVQQLSSDEIRKILRNPEPTISVDEPFAEIADLGAVEGFGVKKFEERPQSSRGNIRGRGRGHKTRPHGVGWKPNREGYDHVSGNRNADGSWLRGRGRGHLWQGKQRGGPHGIKRSWGGNVTVNDPSKLVSKEYSLEALMSAELTPGIPLSELGIEIAQAFGEADASMITQIVEEIGEDKAFDLFNETRQVESAGGMKVNDGSRRRTAGGVFITLFKSDTDVSPETKDRIFEMSRKEQRKFNKAKRRNDNKKAPTEDMVELKPLPDVTEVLGKSNAQTDAVMSDPEIDMAEMES